MLADNMFTLDLVKNQQTNIEPKHARPVHGLHFATHGKKSVFINACLLTR